MQTYRRYIGPVPKENLRYCDKRLDLVTLPVVLLLVIGASSTSISFSLLPSSSSSATGPALPFCRVDFCIFSSFFRVVAFLGRPTSLVRSFNGK